MSKPKQIDLYPRALFDLLNAFQADRRPRELTYKYAREARAFQFDLAGFKGAIKAEGVREAWLNVLCARTHRIGAIVTLYHADDYSTPKIVVK